MSDNIRKKFVDENGQELKVIKVLKSHSPNVQIKVEMKCPLILIQDLDDLGFKTTERVNVDSNVESILSKLKYFNSQTRPLDGGGAVLHSKSIRHDARKDMMQL